MATDSAVTEPVLDHNIAETDDLITSQSRLSFSTSSLGHRDDTEFWSKTRKEMMQPAHSTPERTSSAPNVRIPNEDEVSEDEETEDLAISELTEAVRMMQKFGPLSKI